MSSIPLIPKDYQGYVPEVIQEWKYTTKVEIDNIGCPTQIEVLLDREGFETAPLLFIRLRCGSCVVTFSPSGQVTSDDPILYSTRVNKETLTTETAIKLFEIVIPLAGMAVALHKNGIAIPEVAPVPSIYVKSYKKRCDKRKHEQATLTCLPQDEDNDEKFEALDEKRTRVDGGSIVVN